MKIRMILWMLVLLSSPATAFQFAWGEYAARRTRLMERIPDGMAVIQGATSRTDYYPFFQNNDFMYLCGLEIPDAVLVIDGKNRETTIFFTITEKMARSEGVPLEQVTKTVEVTQLERKLPLEQLGSFLAAKVGEGAVLYTMFQPEELMRECSLEKMNYLRRTQVEHEWDGRLTREQQFIGHLRSRFPNTEIKDCSGLIWDLRVIKTPAEIELLRKAAAIAVDAHKSMMKATRVGMPEYELAAVFEFENKRKGAQDLAYYTIICSAENHPYLHYHKYDRILKDGDFLVIDGGPDLHYYDIDITVSYPVNGKFTPRQREIYEACNAMHEACMKVYRPGLTQAQLVPEVMEVLREWGHDTSLPIWKSFRANFGHYVGMAVHDVGSSPKVLETGMVIANEPLAVFAEENLGVRVEDTILITETGCENLTAGLPRTVAEIESFLARR